MKLCVPDKDGELTDVVLGYDDVRAVRSKWLLLWCDHRKKRKPYRRMPDFPFYGQEYQLDKNENDNNLHSGPNGFSRRRFGLLRIEISDKNAITFSRISPDGENGFPGEFQVSVTYEFTEDNTLQYLL